ncbi:MAG TPA: hypothetical protein PKG52_03495 [bacterium]|mgnify:CR=1 FL=1|nr:hypothetical protein [bacterium]HPS28911.1 hypothetical protein [bacterium]
MILSTDIGVWIASALTIAVLSGLFKDNRVFRLTESVFIGVSAGYFGCVWLISIIFPSIDEAANGNMMILIPIIAGLILFLPRSRESRYSKLVYLPAASISLLYIAIALPLYFEKYVYDMISASIIPLIYIGGDGRVVWDMTVNSWISILGTVSVMWFFVARFYKLGNTAHFFGEIGRFYVLVALGCTFGYTLLSRVILFTGRFDFIVTELFGFRF